MPTSDLVLHGRDNPRYTVRHDPTQSGTEMEWHLPTGWDRELALKFISGLKHAFGGTPTLVTTYTVVGEEASDER